METRPGWRKLKLQTHLDQGEMETLRRRHSDVTIRERRAQVENYIISIDETVSHLRQFDAFIIAMSQSDSLRVRVCKWVCGCSIRWCYALMHDHTCMPQMGQESSSVRQPISSVSVQRLSTELHPD